MQKKYVLVVGGAGFIGSHVNAMLVRAGYTTVVLDNLERGHRAAVGSGLFIQGDIADRALLDQIFASHNFLAVMHFAALADVGESVQMPFRYYQNNVFYTLNLLEVMRTYRIPLIFSSSAAIFGNPLTPKIAEEHACQPINPYGRTKLMVETILKDYDQAHGLRSCCLRYFNAAGGDSQGMLKYFPRKESNLIPRVLQCVREQGCLTINGADYQTPDGTCIRDYIHVEDLATGHIAAMERLIEGESSCQYNLGNGQGFSVREVIMAVEKVTGEKVQVKEGPRREGDPAVLVADATKASRELGWIPRYRSLEEMVLHAWQAR